MQLRKVCNCSQYVSIRTRPATWCRIQKLAAYHVRPSNLCPLPQIEGQEVVLLRVGVLDELSKSQFLMFLGTFIFLSLCLSPLQHHFLLPGRIALVGIYVVEKRLSEQWFVHTSLFFALLEAT
eukprot:5386926-Amphidinium_carterae.1